MEHIWTIENWEKNINLHEQGHRTSLRIRFDKDIDSEVRKSCKEFVSFLRKEYFFPLRVVIYVKNVKKLIAMDGDKVYGTFWSMNDDYSVEPHIRVAAGDYNDLCNKWGYDVSIYQIDFWTGKYYEISSGVFLLLRISTIYYKYYKIYLFLKYLIIRISK